MNADRSRKNELIKDTNHAHIHTPNNPNTLENMGVIHNYYIKKTFGKPNIIRQVHYIIINMK